ncbi:hypothetical protein ACFL4W_02050 [Planctomycetota bacterium]
MAKRNWIVPVLAAVLLSLVLLGCGKPKSEHPSEHPQAAAVKAEHPEAEHPKKEHPKAEAPKKEHPKSEHPAEHPQ